MIKGLHTCKPQNTPRVGDVKQFVITRQVSERTGREWTKIKNPMQGGPPAQLYNVIEVEKSDYADQNGNLSFNLVLEQVQGGNTPMPATLAGRVISAPGLPVQRVQKPNVSLDSPRQHLMRSANLYKLCMSAVDNVIYPNGEMDNDPETWRAAVSSLFIESSSRRTSDGINWWSYIDHMPAKPIPEEPKAQDCAIHAEEERTPEDVDYGSPDYEEERPF